MPRFFHDSSSPSSLGQTSRRLALASVGAWIVALSLTDTSFAQGYYTVTPLPSITVTGAGSRTDRYIALNNHGELAGWHTVSTELPSGRIQHDYRAFLYDGTVRDLPLFPHDGFPPESYAYAINSSGKVVGASSVDSRERAFLYDGAMHNLGALADDSEFTSNISMSRAFGINSLGQVVGESYVKRTDASLNEVVKHAFYYDGAMHDLGILLGQNVASRATGINDAGNIIGEFDVVGNTHGFVYDGVMHDLGAWAIPKAINGQGHVVGVDANRAFFYDGTKHDLGSFGGATGWSEAVGVNRLGQIVGRSSTGVGGTSDYPGFMYYNGKMTPLDSLVNPTSGLTNLTPVAINNRGQILAGVGNNSNNGFLLSPHTYAILIGSDAPSNGIQDAVKGILDVDRVAEQLGRWQSDYQAIENPIVTTIKFNWDDQGRLPLYEIQTAISEVAAKALPGDRLFFYYSGHGATKHPGENEAMDLTKLNSLLDNELAAALSDSRLIDVSKIVLMDMCRAGGMWLNDFATDHDLEELQNIAFLGAAAEDEKAFTVGNPTHPFFGTGTFTNAILSALTPDASYRSLLAAALASQGTVTGFLKDDGFETGTFLPIGFASPGFDMDEQIGFRLAPEPSTAVLGLLGAIGFFALAGRRKLSESSLAGRTGPKNLVVVIKLILATGQR